MKGIDQIRKDVKVQSIGYQIQYRPPLGTCEGAWPLMQKVVSDERKLIWDLFVSSKSAWSCKRGQCMVYIPTDHINNIMHT